MKPGLVLVWDEDGRLDLVWIAADEVEADARRFERDGARVEIVAKLSPREIVARFAALVAEHRPPRNLVVDEPDHPHLLLTSERFPRLLATRRPHRGARTFGPFLPRTAARRLFGLSLDLFKLRTCTIEVDGTFGEPCGEHAAGRCLAPCVAALCPPEVYMEAVEDAALLAAGRAEEVAARLQTRMASAVETLDFESAARWRDAGLALGETVDDLRLRDGLASASDVVAIGRDGDAFGVELVSLERGRVLARREVVRRETDGDDAWLLAQVLAQAYRSGAPRRIFTPFDAPELRLVARGLGVTLDVTRPAARPTKVRLAEIEAEGRLSERFAAIRAGRPVAALDELATALDLAAPLRRVEAFDVAHLAGEATTAASVVFRDGELRPEEFSVWHLGDVAELEAMRHAVAARAAAPDGDRPDLMIVDGGRPQLGAAIRATEAAGRPDLPLLAVAKPPGKPREVAYMLTRVGDEDRRVPIPDGSEAMRLVRLLRDEAHRLANSSHQQFRGALQFARGTDGDARRSHVAVPTRFDDPDGAASDLRPIAPRTRPRRRVPERDGVSP